MTTEELNTIVQAVIAELEKSGVDFDYKAQAPEDSDLVFVIRGTAPDYQGVTVTWKGLLDIITAQATQAKTDAVNAKDIAQQILTQVQSKGTEITNFVATSKTEIETQKNESVNAVKSVYQTDLNELKGDLSDLNNIIFPYKKTAKGTFVGGWTKTTVIDNIDFIFGKQYKITIKMDEAPTTSSYLWVMKQDGTEIVTPSVKDVTEKSVIYTPLTSDLNGCYIQISSESFKGNCVISVSEVDSDNISKNTKHINELEYGYKTFEGVFVYGNNYGTFDGTDKYKAVSVLPLKFDYDISVKCDDGYEFIVNYFDDNGVYLKSSVWKQYGEVYKISANSIFRICIASKDTSLIVDTEEIKTKVQYSTKIEKRISKIESKISEIESNVDTEIRKFNSAEFAVGERYDSFNNSIKTKITNVNSFTFDYDVPIKCGNGYRFLVLTYDESDKFKTSSGWKTADDVFTVTANEPFRVSVEKETPENVTNIAEYVNAISYFTEIGSNIIELKNDMKTKLPTSNLFHIIKRNKYFSHIDVDYYTGLIIPSQSIFDVRRSKRLGFEMMELNVRKTSDGVFYSFHGSKNCFGDAFQSVDGTDISAVDVSTVTSDYIQTNIRYKSKYSKYQVAPSTLRDTLIECKKYDIVPLLEYSDGVVDFAKSIMGDNLFLLGTYNRDRSTLDCGDYVCVGWLTGTAQTVIAKAQKSGGAYACGINVTDSMYANYSEADWTNFIGEIHKAGYFVSCSYQNQVQEQKLLNGGIDIMASRGEINDIEYGNLFNSESDMNYSDFSTNGSVSDGVLSLTSGGTIAPNGITENVFLGGASLKIIFEGKIHVKMGVVDAEFESDGKKTMWFSSFFQETVPSFLITAVEYTEILEISFKASKM